MYTSLKNVDWGHHIIVFWLSDAKVTTSGYILTLPGLKISNKISALEMTKNFEKKFSGKRVINMDTKPVRELRSITKTFVVIISLRRLTWLLYYLYIASITESETSLLCNLLNPGKLFGPKAGSDYFNTKYGVLSVTFSTTRLISVSMGIWFRHLQLLTTGF